MSPCYNEEKRKGLTIMFTIDQERCVRCGACVKTCPMSVFRKDESGTVTARDRACLDCYHCTAVCPVEAITCSESDKTALPLPEGEGLLAKVQRRRSIRYFKPDTPDRAVIQAALDGAAYAPSAKNDRAYQWTVILGREAVERLYRIILDWAGSEPEFRALTWLARRGINPITCGAPCLVLVHCPDSCSNPVSDSVIAMTLAEQLLNDAGLGTCWGGYFHRAVQQCAELRAALNIPEGHEVYGVLMVGAPDERFPRIPVRPAAQVNWVE